MWLKGQKNTEKGSNFEQNSIKWRFTVVVQANRVVNIAHSIVLEYVLGTKGHNSQITWWHGTINRHNFQKKGILTSILSLKQQKPGIKRSTSHFFCAWWRNRKQKYMKLSKTKVCYGKIGCTAIFGPTVCILIKMIPIKVEYVS